MDFNLKMGRLMAILGVIYKFIFMWPFLLCVVPWVIYFMFGVVWVLDFNFLTLDDRRGLL